MDVVYSFGCFIYLLVPTKQKTSSITQRVSPLGRWVSHKFNFSAFPSLLIISMAIFLDANDRSPNLVSYQWPFRVQKHSVKSNNLHVLRRQVNQPNRVSMKIGISLQKQTIKKTFKTPTKCLHKMQILVRLAKKWLRLASICISHAQIQLNSLFFAPDAECRFNKFNHSNVFILLNLQSRDKQSSENK